MNTSNEKTTTPHWPSSGLGAQRTIALHLLPGSEAARRLVANLPNLQAVAFPTGGTDQIGQLRNMGLHTGDDGRVYAIQRSQGRPVNYVLVQQQLPNHGHQDFWFTYSGAHAHTNTIKLRGVPEGLGDIPPDLLASAQALVAYFAAAPCTQSSVSVVVTFQEAYNASGYPGSLTVDGQYGGNTQRALQNVLNTAPAVVGGGPAQAAPTNCFGGVVLNGTNYGVVPDVPTPDSPTIAPVTPVTPISPTPVSPTSTPMSPWLIAGAAVLGATGIYYVYKHRRRSR